MLVLDHVLHVKPESFSLCVFTFNIDLDSFSISIKKTENTFSFQILDSNIRLGTL
jgi:hypothetical protein